MSQVTGQVVCLAAGLTLMAVQATDVWAVAANPLQSAYWRFEEGTANNFVDHTVSDPVKDSLNSNHLDAFGDSSEPLYVSDVPPTPLKSGAANHLALDFAPNNDLFTLYTDGDQGKALGKKINNGTISNTGGFTLEAAFRPGNLGFFQAIVAKEGRPVGGDTDIGKLPTLELKIRGDDNKLQIEQFDGAKALKSVSSINPMNVGQWYYAAVVNDGAQLSLYLDSTDGQGYQLQGAVPVDHALYQGDNGYGADPHPDWSNSWTIGRGQFNGSPADFYQGVIDEVRLSNTALSPTNFLFAPAVDPIAGDYNNNGTVDTADYVVWRDNQNGAATLPHDTTPGTVTTADYDVWKANFGKTLGSGLVSAPEPVSVFLAFTALSLRILIPRHRADMGPVQARSSAVNEC
jgi:hypothetical protein